MATPRFQGKVALVTGGNSGIGLAAAKAFAAEGARVVIAGRDPETMRQAKSELGSSAIAIQADVSKVADIDRLMSEIAKQAGRIDALFVNAGIGNFVPIEAVDEALFDRHFGANVKGAFFTVQKALPLMPKGSAIAINASAVIDLGLPNSSVYTMTKAAIASLARSLSLELAPRGVRLNIVNPGPIETPIFGKMGLSADQTREMASQIVSKVPLARFGSPEEIAKAVLFLCSDDASFVHGASLNVDGGMSSL